MCPVLTEADDTKLAKARRSVRLGTDSPLPQLLAVFALLGLPPPDSLSTAQSVAGLGVGDSTLGHENGCRKRLNVRVTG